jgi:ABC-2 type transport system permease protein
MFLAPLITMRLLAEEKHRGTVEQLYTLPLRDRDIVFGKYLAAMGMVAVMLLVIMVDLAVVFWFTEVEPLILLSGLLSVLLMGAAFIALGLFISSVTRSMMTAATLTFGANLGQFFLGDLVARLPGAGDAPDEAGNVAARTLLLVYDAVLQAVARLAADAHVKDLTLGLFRLEDVVFYVLYAAFFIFLTFRALESRFWRA